MNDRVGDKAVVTGENVPTESGGVSEAEWKGRRIVCICVLSDCIDVATGYLRNSRN